jgi:Icc-related predicted phosphoesterase
VRLLCITDLHGRQATLQEILDEAGTVDAVLLGGDLTDFETPNVAEGLVRLAQARCPAVFAVAGNCDSPEIDARLIDLGVSLFGRGTHCGELGLYGVSAMPPWTGSMYELTEQEIADALERGYQQIQTAAVRVMLSHTPPRDTLLDAVAGNRHVGSTSVRQAIGAQQPALVVCGHIHEARGVDRLAATTIVNCGPAYRGHYALADVDSRVDVQLCTTRHAS